MNKQIIETFAREYGKNINNVIFPVFLKNEWHSWATDRAFKWNRRDLSLFNPPYLSYKGLIIKP